MHDSSKKHSSRRGSRRAQRRKKIRQGIAISVTVLLTLGLVGYETYQFIRRRDQKAAILQAAGALQNREFNRAIDQAQQAVQIDNGNIEAYRLLAEACDQAGLAEAIKWRGMVNQLQPGV